MFAYLLILSGVCLIDCATVHQSDLLLACRQAEQAACDLSFGKRQVEQVICDQTDMGRIINREPVLRMMLIWYFAGELKGYRVYWDYREPIGGQPAEHLPSIMGYPALIRVSNKRGNSAVDKCTMLLFELQNLEIDKEYQLLVSLPAEARKSRNEFATSCVRHEFIAGKKTKLFFLQNPLVGASVKNDPNYFLTIQESGDFSGYLHWLDTLDGEAYNPLKYYRRAYDGLLPAPKY